MNYNYHTHTYLCGHATGTFAEYVEKAIEGGIKYMGFSDHIPHIDKDGTEKPFRVQIDKASGYISEVSQLREKYKDKIEISIGFESEYFPDVFDDMVNYAVDIGAEYLIHGSHFLSEEYVSTFTATDSQEFLKAYPQAKASETALLYTAAGSQHTAQVKE